MPVKPNTNRYCHELVVLMKTSDGAAPNDPRRSSQICTASGGGTAVDVWLVLLGPRAFGDTKRAFVKHGGSRTSCRVSPFPEDSGVVGAELGWWWQ